MVVGSNVAEGRKKIDATVGELVWVRRKNGSWWPGQIVGLDEISETSLDGPRSGTPIKLLARDDTSVDWHDLETSKAVKAFRCGDYDSCIEKAEAAAAKASKRTSKYPRREDAIICALEIEKTRLSKECPNHSSASDPDSEPLANGVKGSTSISNPSKDSDFSSEGTSSGTAKTCENNSNSTQDPSHSGISYEESNESSYLKGKELKARRKTPNDSEDDASEGRKRMKGLDDLGVAAERKVQVLALANPVPQTSVSINNFHTSNGTRSVGSLANGNSVPTLKKKSSHVVHIHELLKKKYRHRPLTKVLENTTMVPVPIICDESVTPFERSDAITPSNECGNANKDGQLCNGKLLEDDSSDMLFDVPFVDEDLNLSGSSSGWKPSCPPRPPIGALKVISCRNFGHDKEADLNYSLMNEKLEKTASKWQSKGKRKARNISKTEDQYSRMRADIDNEKSDDVVFGFENLDRFSPSSSGLVNGFTERRKHISLSASQRAFPYQPRFFVHAGYEMPDAKPRGIYIDSSLYEVEITVEATRPQAHHVPYISLMSKLSGKPITGHPLVVEPLDDGYCDIQFSDYPASGSCELDDEDVDTSLTFEPTARKTKKIKSRSSFSLNKPSKSKRHGPSSKKTRKLSSLTGLHKQNPEKAKSMAQNSGGPILACVPLKVVFSRINEALNGSSRSAHRSVALNNT